MNTMIGLTVYVRICLRSGNQGLNRFGSLRLVVLLLTKAPTSRTDLSMKSHLKADSHERQMASEMIISRCNIYERFFSIMQIQT